MPNSEVDVPPMARALEPPREESPTQDTVNESLVGTMTTDFVRAKLRHCVPTQEIESNPRDALALGRPLLLHHQPAMDHYTLFIQSERSYQAR